MMQNLQIEEGQLVVLTLQTDVPRGIYCRLEPEDAAFLDLAADIGPKLLMESALRRYSVLSVDETIVIDHGDQRFYLRVVELKPAPVVSLLGDVDLEMDFALPPSASLPSRLHRPTSSKPREKHQTPQDFETEATAEDGDRREQDLQIPESASSKGASVACGRRLGDGAHVLDTAMPSAQQQQQQQSQRERQPHSQKQGTPKGPSSASFQAAARRRQSVPQIEPSVLTANAETSRLAQDVRMALPAFASTGHTLGGDRRSEAESQAANDEPPLASSQAKTLTNENPEGATCPHCLSNISPSNLELHVLRCERNTAYHRVCS
ncbi:hypothetical protein PINS_up000838 [Pythium insidiosum]|nr:hypothetical protein PINS_up000838 [Pythium insidiosum]